MLIGRAGDVYLLPVGGQMLLQGPHRQGGLGAVDAVRLAGEELQLPQPLLHGLDGLPLVTLAQRRVGNLLGQYRRKHHQQNHQPQGQLAHMPSNRHQVYCHMLPIFYHTTGPSRERLHPAIPRGL